VSDNRARLELRWIKAQTARPPNLTRPIAVGQPERQHIPNSDLISLAAALGVGLLIGAERERRKQEKRSPSVAGIRTFAVASAVGAVSFMLGGAMLLAVATAAVAALAVLGGWRSRQDDPNDAGVTTEVALVLTVLLGALAIRAPTLAAGAGVTVAILLAARTPIHRFVDSVLSEAEVRDGLIFAGASLVVLPLLPDRAMGPFAALNPHSIWIVVLLVLGIGAAGHVAVRWLGARFGLPVAGLATGFVSSIAAIGAMGARARKDPQVLAAAVAGAVLSTVATIVQLAIVIGVTNMPTLQALAAPLACAGLAAVAYGAAFTLRAIRQPVADEPPTGKAFSLTTALAFAATLSVILLASAALRQRFGETGSIAAAALAGLVDTHAAAISLAAQVASGQMPARDAVVPVLASLTTNAATKLVFAATSGGRAFALRVAPGIALVVVAAWAGAYALRLVS
jgi:uncharacterized membrane protein (DUF4010 family)